MLFEPFAMSLGHKARFRRTISTTVANNTDLEKMEVFGVKDILSLGWGGDTYVKV